MYLVQVVLNSNQYTHDCGAILKNGLNLLVLKKSFFINVPDHTWV